MARYRSSFFKKGVDNQKRSNMVILLRRPSVTEITTWTNEEKEHASDWIKQQRKIFDAFIITIEEGITATNQTL
jgi:hypothetical protein